MPGIPSHIFTIYKFNWRIENFGLCNHDNYPTLPSLPFSFETIEKTTWQLTLYPDQNDRNYINCDLTRTNEGSSIEKIQFNFTLSVVGEGGACHFRKKLKEVCLLALQKFPVHHLIDRRLLRQNDLIKEALTIVFEMSLSEQMYDSNFNNNSDREFLSTDLKKLYESELFSDMTISTTDRSLKVHKFILRKRWPGLFEELQRNNLNHVPFPSSFIEALLRFVYCGKSELNDIPNELYGVAFRYKLEELIDLADTLPTEVSCLTEIRTTNIILDWPLDDMQSWENNSLPFFREVCLEGFDSDMSVKFDIEGPISNEMIKIEFSFPIIVPGKPIFMKCKISLVADGDEIVDSREEKCVLVDSHPWTFPPFIDTFYPFKNKRRRLMDIKLVCDLTVSDGIFYSKYTETYIEISAEPHRSVDIHKLSSDIYNLFLVPDYSNVILKCEGKHFFAHSAILGCRSEVFKEKLLDVQPGISCVIDILDLESSVLNLLLQYIYGKEIQEKILLENVHGLQKASTIYKVTALKNKCDYIISRQLK